MFGGAGLRRRARRVPLHGRCADAVTEPAEFAVDSAVSPGGVLPRQSQHQVVDVLAGARPAGPVGCVHLRVIRRRCQARSVPGVTRRARSTAGRCRASAARDGTIGPVRRGPGDLTAKHRDLMTQDHDLRVFGRLAATQQRQPSEDPDRDQVEQAKGHKSRSCRNEFIGRTAGCSTCDEF